MQAIILAAGMGKRLKDLTANNTKCMVKVNGVTLIERMLQQLDGYNLSRIVIVIGYQGEKLKDFIKQLSISTAITYIENSIYDKTNNIYSLALAKNWLVEDDTLLLESDLIFEDSVLNMLIDDARPSLALVDKYESWMDGTCLKLSEDDSIERFIPGSQFVFSEMDEYYKTVNIYKFSRDFSKKYYVPFLDAYQKALGQNEYYEQVLRVITMVDKSEIKAIRLQGQKWYEIDDIQDLNIAESIFTPDEDEKVKLFQERYGGYWRYPGLLDFSYLVNPYFPTSRMKDEIRANFNKLVTEYPSGMKINSLLAAKNFGVHQQNIVVGNGAAELIKALMEYIDGTTGFIRPTFEEYPNRCARDNSIVFVPDNDDFSYSVDDIMGFFGDKNIDNLIIVNPDNPSGNYMPKRDILKLVDWAKKKEIKIIIDESFVDFSDEIDSSIIDQGILENNDHLYVIKSISKSYGIPGLRLGILAAGDVDAIRIIKKNISIWNINSIAEFYMQIEEKYIKDYKKALVKVRNERRRFQEKLAGIKGVRVVPSQGNFVMIKISEAYSAPDILKSLLVEHNILIKDLSYKTGNKNYVRIAVRNEEDDDALLKALEMEISARM